LDLGDKLTIETPEQIALEFPLAGIGSRFLAFFVDSLIQFVVALGSFIVAALVLPDLGKYWPSAWNWTAAVYVFAGFCLYWGYFAFFETVWKGQTPGKRHASLRVIHHSGRAINIFESIARNFMRVIDSLPGMYGVGCITMFLDPKNRRLGDFVAGTVVVHERKDEAQQPLWDNETANDKAVKSDVAALLTLQEFELIEAFLSRRLDLTPEVRHDTAERIARRVGDKLSVPAHARGSDENFLESIVHQYRDTAQYHVK
jgi:uncharacterized RDD family membrane protein YckC